MGFSGADGWHGRDSGGDGTGILSFQRILTVEEVRNYGTNPVQVIPAPGIDKFIELISVSASKIWNAAGYAAGEAGLQPKLIGLDVLIRAIWDTDFLAGFLNTARQCGQADILGDFGSPGTITQFPLNDGVEITSVDGADPGNNPTVGDTQIVVYGLYRIVTIPQPS